MGLFQNFEELNGTDNNLFYEEVSQSNPTFTASDYYKGTQALQLDIAAGGGTVKVYPYIKNINLERALGLNLWMYDTQGNNKPTLTLIDYDGNTSSSLSDNAATQNQWTQLLWTMGAFSGINNKKIVGIELNEANAGTYYIDEIGYEPIANDIIGIRDNIIHFLMKNNLTTTGGVSYNLNSSVRRIIGGHPPYSAILSTELPMVMVDIADYEEMRNTLGTAARRDVNMVVDLYAITQYGIGLGINSITEMDNESLQLTQNLLDVVRQDGNVSMASFVINGAGVEFIYDATEENNYVKAAKISLRCFKYAK